MCANYYQKSFQTSSCSTCNKGSKVAVLHPLPPLNEGLAFIKCGFLSHQLHLSKTHDQCLEIDDRRSRSIFGDVTWPSSHFTDLSLFYGTAFYTGVDKPAGAAGAACRQFYVTQAGHAQIKIFKYYILHFG